MGTPLKEQLSHQHPGADKDCEGCHGSGWLTALVDSPDLLEDAGLDKPADFLMKCDECGTYDSDDEAIEAARRVGMFCCDLGHVTYTESQLKRHEVPQEYLTPKIQFYVFEAADDSNYNLLLHTDEDVLNQQAGHLLTSLNDRDEIDTYAFGTVRAVDVEEASDKVRNGDWSYSQRV